MMIYRDAKLGMRFQVTCAACEPIMFTDEDAQAEMNATITEYYSMDHALDEGWVATKDRMFCEPGNDYAWICPACAAKIEWTKRCHS